MRIVSIILWFLISYRKRLLPQGGGRSVFCAFRRNPAKIGWRFAVRSPHFCGLQSVTV